MSDSIQNPSPPGPSGSLSYDIKVHAIHTNAKTGHAVLSIDVTLPRPPLFQSRWTGPGSGPRRESRHTGVRSLKVSEPKEQPFFPYVKPYFLLTTVGTVNDVIHVPVSFMCYLQPTITWMRRQIPHVSPGPPFKAICHR